MNNNNETAVAPANKNNLEVRNSAQAVSIREQLACIPISRETGIQISNIGQATLIADLLVKGGYAPKGASVEFATVAILQGALLGLNPIQSLQNIAVVNGRPTLYGDGMAAVVKSSKSFAGEKVEYVKGEKDNPLACVFKVWRRVNDKDVETEETFSVADARRAGLWPEFDEKGNLVRGKIGPWKTNPKQMLFNRARAFAYRHAFPDLLQGIRCYEEERDIIDITPEPETRKETMPEKTQSKLRATLHLPAPAPAESIQVPKAQPKEVAPVAGATVEPVASETIPGLDN